MIIRKESCLYESPISSHRITDVLVDDEFFAKEMVAKERLYQALFLKTTEGILSVRDRARHQGRVLQPEFFQWQAQLN